MRFSRVRISVRSKMGAVAISGAVLGLASLFATPRCATAVDGPPRRLDPRIELILRWLPEDTETVFVARSVTLTEMKPDPLPSWQEVGVGLATGDLDVVDGGKYAARLRGRKVACVVSGARGFEGATKTDFRREGCAILVFEAALGGAAREWTEALRRGAKSVRTLAGREVFVFPSPRTRGAFGGPKDWEGVYFTLAGPDTVLCASSDRYLEAVLRRSDGAPGRRALPDDLPEWGHVDFDAPVWMLRHVPPDPRGRTAGVTAAFSGRSARAVYVPKAGAELSPRLIQGVWRHDPVRVESRRDGTIEVRCDDGLRDDSTFIDVFNFYYLQGINSAGTP